MPKKSSMVADNNGNAIRLQASTACKQLRERIEQNRSAVPEKGKACTFASFHSLQSLSQQLRELQLNSIKRLEHKANCCRICCKSRSTEAG